MEKTQPQEEIDIDSIGINLNRNLTKLMEDNGVSLTTLHRNTGITIPTIKRLQSDPTSNPTITTLLPIANFFHITLSQLISSEPLPDRSSGHISNKTNWFEIPVIEWSQILEWIKSEDSFKASSYILVDIDVGEKAYALKVEEDDWLIIAKGSVLIVNANLRPSNKDYAIVYKNEQNIPSLKQVLIDEQKVYLKPMNPYFPISQLDESQRFLGVVMQFRKDLKISETQK